MNDATKNTLTLNRSKEQKGSAMRLYIAASIDGRTFRPVFRCRLSNQGNGPVAKKWQGSHYSYLARQAARQFGAVPAMTRQEFKVGRETIHVLKITGRTK